MFMPLTFQRSYKICALRNDGSSPNASHAWISLVSPKDNKGYPLLDRVHVNHPHVHTVLWVKNASEIDEHDHVVRQFIDMYQTCEMTTDSAKFQQRKHSTSCKRHGGCRFSYPHPPSRNTIIATPVVRDAVFDTMKDQDEGIFQFERSLNDRYAARPSELEPMSLDEFTSTYTEAYGEMTSDET
ncbi:hypothetical protein Bbelb_391220 [Branchiostoma belcheri]|nr:hypothetical protein Bbelb_391220 [Branchiostoma belcheri]